MTTASTLEGEFNMETKTHFKMYKDGRIWVVAGITTVATSLMLFSTATLSPTRAMAAENSTTEPTISTVTTTTNTGQTATLGQATSTSTSAPTATSDSGESPAVAPVTDTSTGSGSAQATESPETPQAETSVASQPDADSQSTGTTQSDTVNPTESTPNTTASTTQPTATTAASTTPVARTARMAAAEPVATDPTADAATTDTTPTGSISTTAPDASDLTGVIKATDKFNVSKTDVLQWSYQHASLDKVPGQGAWQGADYAAQIASDASGVDPQTNKYYLDEWMPDEAFQYFLYSNNYQDQYTDFNAFRAAMTKDTLSQLTAIQTTEAKQHEGNYQDPTVLTNYMTLMGTETLEGLQYATNLTTLALNPSTSINVEVWGDSLRNANLWDISALAPLTKLQSVRISKFAVTDISALADKPDLSSVDLSYNQISDISPLATDPKLDVSKANLAYQHLLLAPITLKTGTAAYTTPSFIVKDLQDNNVPITAFNPTSSTYPGLFPSTADGGNLDDITLAWSQMLNDTAANYGSFTTTWKDANSNFEGWIIQPYLFQDAVGNVTVNYQLLQADGKQLSLYPTSVLAGTVGSDFDLNNSTAVSPALQTIMGDKGLVFSGVILTGTGKYSDYTANNGLAQRVSTTGTYTDAPQTLTLLFLKQWQVQVNYGVIQPDGTTVSAIMDNNGQPLQQQINGDLSTPISLYGNNGIVANLPGYIYAGVQTRTDTTNWTPLANNATEIPFIDGNQSVLVLYRVAQSATVTYQDQTTGQVLKTVTPTDDSSLTGVAGQTSSYSSHDQIAAYEQQGYRLVSDATLTADGKSAMVFGDTGQPTNYVVTLAHTYRAGDVNTVTAKITYVDQAGQSVAAPSVQTKSFVTVTDNTVANDAGTTYYSDGVATQAPTLTPAGQPTDSKWTAGNTAAFSGVVNPVVSSYHVVATTDPSGSLTQVTPAAVTAKSADSMDQVTYGLNQSQLTVNYVDLSGQPIAKPTTQSGDQGTTFSIDVPVIAGYRPVQINPQPVTGTYHGDQMTLTLHYEANPIETVPATTQLTINYVDRNGQSIMAPTTQSGDQGTKFSIDVPTIDGYRPVQINPQPVTGTYHGNQMTLTLHYDANPVETVPTTTQLTVNYVDRNGQPIAPSTTQSGDQGTKFSIDVPAIDGYRSVQINPQPVAGTYHGDQMTLTLHYDTIPVETTPATAQLTINYVDNNGQPISAPTTQSGDQGTGFSVTAPTIPGYQLADPQQQTVAGTYHGNDMTLTLTYNTQPTTPVVTEPDTATPPAVTPTDNGGTTSTVDTPSTDETPTVVQPTQPDQPAATVVSEPSTTTTQPTPKPADQAVTTDDAAATVVADYQTGNRVAQSAVTTNSTIANRPNVQQSTATTRLPQTSETSPSWFTALGAGLLTLVSGLGAGIVARQKRRGR
ncbi:hypothetical protein FD14_GL000139 [Secundilactobacillus similis DSM 23365 = JCM 2765]|uniref:Gram-positive cocci surface proteins LPxTG domain-containing protein n=3 Tax=Secundilactobacillus similis TaxID=414682 RepID=A0A0R2FN72_9LACO|nr:hypothetical protein FD14_GL000139 [Secundilactobacillus similis DSM 23365 = JCM 2765]